MYRKHSSGPLLSTLYIYLLLILSSCSEEITISGFEGNPPPYAATSILYADSIAKVYLSKASYLDDDTAYGLADAEVYIINAGEEESRELLSYNGEYYEGQQTLKAGQNYLLEIILPDLTELHATTYIPQPVPVSFSKLLVPSAGSHLPGTSDAVIVRFDDPPSTANYYEILFYQIQHDFSGAESGYSILKTTNEDEIILAEGLQESRLYSHVFSDAGYDGKEITLEFACNIPNFSDWKVYCVLNSVSKDYYEYKKSLYRHLYALSIDSEFSTDDLYNPAIFKSLDPVYSNIKGGKGVFSGISQEVKHSPCNLVGYGCQ